MHAELKRLAKNDGNCKAVGQKAAQLLEQYPDYYNANVANDRDLKGCQQYINNAQNDNAEKRTKSRAQKRPADMEAPMANH
jgi:hypothetical protein